MNARHLTIVLARVLGLYFLFEALDWIPRFAAEILPVLVSGETLLVPLGWRVARLASALLMAAAGAGLLLRAGRLEGHLSGPIPLSLEQLEATRHLRAEIACALFRILALLWIYWTIGPLVQILEAVHLSGPTAWVYPVCNVALALLRFGLGAWLLVHADRLAHRLERDGPDRAQPSQPPRPAPEPGAAPAV